MKGLKQGGLYIYKDQHESINSITDELDLVIVLDEDISTGSIKHDVVLENSRLVETGAGVKTTLEDEFQDRGRNY